MILIVEDSETDQKIFRVLIGDRAELVFCRTWLTAAAHVRQASAVIMDWNLADGLNAIDSGALDVIKKKGLPYVVTTVSPQSVPDSVGEVIDKGNMHLMRSAITRLISQAQLSSNP